MESKKLAFVLLKTLGIIVCVLVAIITIAVSAPLYFENHDFSDGKHIFLNPEHIKMTANSIPEFAAQIYGKE